MLVPERYTLTIRKRERVRGANNYLYIAMLVVAYMSIWFVFAYPLPTLTITLLAFAALAYRNRRRRQVEQQLHTLLFSGDYNSALAYAKGLGTPKKQTIKTRHYTALGLWHRDEKDEALAVMRELHEEASQYPLATLDYVGMLLEHRTQTGALEEAETQLQRLDIILPNDPLVAVYRSRVAVIREQPDKAAHIVDVMQAAWPGDPDLTAQRAAVHLAAGNLDEARTMVDRAREKDRRHPHALVLHAAITGKELDKRKARENLHTDPHAFFAADLGPDHDYRAPLDESQPHLSRTTAALAIERDLGGLTYSVSTWERLHPLVQGIKFSMVAFMLLFVAHSTFAFDSVSILGSVLKWGSIGAAGVAGLGGLLMAGFVVLGRGLFRAQVTVDRVGMRTQKRSGAEHVSWASCEAVRRRGRLVEVQRTGAWHALPSPNGVVDAQWLEDLISEQLAANTNEPDALPTEAARALEKLTQRT